MKSLRKFAVTAVLSFSALGLLSAAASAQTARGSFTLPHEVRWQNVTVPAGEYRFSIDEKGPSQLMTLSQLDGAHTSLMLLVNSTAPTRSGSLDRLVLVSREGKTFVQSMELPYYGLTLNFKVPTDSAELALAGEHPDPTRNR